MKNLNLLFYFILFASGISLTSCGDDETSDDMVSEEMSILETALNTDTENLSLFVEAVSQVGLTATFDQNGPFTVFPPTNAAFQALLDSNSGWNSLSDIDNATLTNVLLFHLLGAELESTDLVDSYVTTAATGPNNEQISLQIDVTGGIVLNGSALPVDTDIVASNGIIHVIDEVMLPPSVVELAANNAGFSSLIAALSRTDLSIGLIAMLSGDGPYTIFAPTDAAFQDLLDTNINWGSVNDIPADLLETILLYHVIAESNVQSDQLSQGQTIITWGENTFDIDPENEPEIQTGSGQFVNIILTDIQGWNGVIHAIDEVLIP